MKQIKIALVDPPLSGHKLRGTGIYTLELYKALQKQKEVIVSLVDIKSDFSAFDIVHYPYFDPFFLTLPIIKKKPTVVTVHDLIPLKFPKYFPKGIRGEIKWRIQKFSLRDSQAIITDSFASKKDIISYTGISENKINVAYLGVKEEFKLIKSQGILNDIRKKYNLPEKFVLYVGDVNYNKNIEGIIKAFLGVLDQITDINLVLVGKGFVDDTVQLRNAEKYIYQLGLEKKVKKLGFIALSDLVGVYNLAAVYLQPSFAEGFGLGVLEAMACGCPVVTSNTSSLPELVKDAAILVNPNDSLEISKSIIKFINDINIRNNFIERGLKRVKNFTWKKCAQETVKIYRNIL